MMTWAIAVPCVISWLVASRLLFRHWVRHDSLKGYRRCPKPGHWSYYRAMDHNYAGHCCLAGKHETYALPLVVALAMVVGMFWPVMALAGVVMWRRPQSSAETQARIAELERELEVRR